MPDNSLTITFTDRGEDAIHNMLNQIQNLAGILDESGTPDVVVNGVLKEKDESGDEELSEAATDEVENVQMDKFKNDNSLSEDEQKKAFKQHLKDIERFAETLNLDKNIPSKLYKDVSNGKYYLFVKKGKLKFGDYTRVCHKLTEYAKLCSQQAYIEQYCKEHFECLISKNALKVLKEY